MPEFLATPVCRCSPELCGCASAHLLTTPRAHRLLLLEDGLPHARLSDGAPATLTWDGALAAIGGGATRKVGLYSSWQIAFQSWDVRH